MIGQEKKNWLSQFTKHHTLVIAEAGVNHNGDMALAHQLIDAAAAAGADFVKFQTFKTEDLVIPEAELAHYQKSNAAAGETQFALLKKLELRTENHQELLAHCHTAGIGFLSTPFDSGSVDLLKSLGLQLFKIPSGEITNLPLLQQIGGLQKHVLLSTGMATLAEVEEALVVLEKAGTPRAKVGVLHCTTQYPAPYNTVNLRALQTLKESLGIEVGYSDHTLGIEVPVAAVALGASIIEKHFTLNRNLPGPDHQASLEPSELAAMVSAIRNIEQALGDGVKKPAQSEMQNLVPARKSIFLAKALKKGDEITLAHLAMKRPGNGISPMRLAEVVGKTAVRDLAPGQQITFQDLMP